jgi:Family of unknown function (DUF6064)
MSAWWTYRLSDILPFSPQTYYRLFELHNAAVWPAQLLAFAAGLAILALLISRPPWAGRTIALLLAATWAFVAWSYFHVRYAPLNWAAVYSAYAFAAEALLLVLSGALGRITFATPWPLAAKTGSGIVLFALFLQPLIGPLFGRSWSGVELFGIAPDPTVLATLGVLLAAERMRWELLAIPLTWCAVTGATLWAMSSPEALLMPATGLLALALALSRSLRKA